MPQLPPPPNILPIKIKSLKITTYKSVYSNNSSVDIRNNRYTNAQNCILLNVTMTYYSNTKSRPRKLFAPPPSNPQHIPCIVLSLYDIYKLTWNFCQIEDDRHVKLVMRMHDEFSKQVPKMFIQIIFNTRINVSYEMHL